VLPRVLAARKRVGLADEPVRILSLPCSTGEEPYSIALRLLEEWPLIDDVDVELHAGDIDSAVLHHARQGVYGARSLQRVPEPWLRRHFTPLGEGHHQLSADIRAAVSFSQINVTDSDQMRGLHRFDVVFCRNMLIYFDEVSSRRAAENLYGALRPGGYLFLGHSESMSRISPIFTPCRLPEGLVYQRPSHGATA
jgi:chemotaxis protein methyltransferase CheR